MLRMVLALSVIALLGPGCSGGPGLSVDLRTDLAPSHEFVRIETTLAADVASDAGEQSQRVVAQNVMSSGDYLRGVRIADYANVPRGDYVLRVDLLDLHGIVTTRHVALTVTGHVAVTVVVTRNCVSVTCPPSSDPTLTECVDDQCVDPRCSPSTPDFCPTTPSCTVDSDCHAEGCGRASCASGTCLFAPDDMQCALGQTCFGGTYTCIAMDLDAGVSPFPPPGDGGMGTTEPWDPDDPLDPFDDAGSGTGTEICNNGIDDNGNGQIDCAEPSCATYNCNDGNLCTFNDICRAGVCAGTHHSCANGDSLCPANACTGKRRCTTAPAPAGTACAGGVNLQPCNGDYCDGMGHCMQDHRRTDGASCGSSNDFHCCAGLCVDITSDETNCGACGVHCPGMCSRLPSTNFGTCGCTTDANCQGYGAGAWCSPGGRCQCSCGCIHDQVGCDVHCGDACGSSAAVCSDVEGQDNFCFYPGG